MFPVRSPSAFAGVILAALLMCRPLGIICRSGSRTRGSPWLPYAGRVGRTALLEGDDGRAGERQTMSSSCSLHPVELGSVTTGDLLNTERDELALELIELLEQLITLLADELRGADLVLLGHG